MTRCIQTLLFALLIAASCCPIKCCLNSASKKDLDDVRYDVQALSRQVHHLENNHENFVAEYKSTVKSSSTSTKLPDFTNQIKSLKEDIDELVEKQDHLEKQDSVGKLAKQVEDKIIRLENILIDLEKRSNKQTDEFRELLLKEMEKSESVQNNLEDFLANVTDLESVMQKNYTLIQEALQQLKKVVNSDLKAKVEDFDKHINVIRSAKNEADVILKDIQTDVDKIRPNTFNKENLVYAFFILIVGLFVLACWIYKLQQTIDTIKKSQ